MEAIDIIIPLAKDKYRDFFDLRTALRSIEKNLSGYGKIWLIGEKPGWIQNVQHIPMQDIYKRKQYSIFRKVLAAAENENVSDKFIRWDDDTYLLEKLHVDEMKHWYSGTIVEWSYKNIHPLYKIVVDNTLKHFHNGLYYDIHQPHIYEKWKYKELAYYPWQTTELLTKTMYFNTIKSDPVKTEDCKQVKGLFYSTGNKLSSADIRLMRDQFPNKSIYEK